jgi:O-methyltransferase domain
MSNPENDRLKLDLLIRGFQVSRIIRVLADFSVADKIDSHGSLAIGTLATQCKVKVGPLLRMLRAVACFDVFSVGPRNEVRHTPLSILLRTDTPASMCHSARFWTTSGSWRAWEYLDVALQGEVPHVAAWGTTRFEYLKSHHDESRIFDAMMANFPDNRHEAIATAYDFSGAQKIIDVGGGTGATLKHILSRHAGPKGVTFDRQDVVSGVDETAFMDGRLSAQAGDFLVTIPSGGDIYLMVRVLHDWSDEKALQILKTCRAAMKPTARLLICELVLDQNPKKI